MLFKEKTVPLIVSFALIATILFPFTQIYSSTSYTQPYSLVVALLVFAFAYRSRFSLLKKLDWLALVVFASYGSILYILTCWPYTEVQSIKYLIAYAAPMITVLSVLWSLEKNASAVRASISIAALVWILVGWVQYLGAPTFATSLVGSWGEVSSYMGQSGRGVLGLAPEPTHHGFHMLILAAALILVGKTRFELILVAFSLFSAAFLAAASSALLALGLAALGYVFRNRAKYLFVVVAFVLFAPSFFDAINDAFDIGNSRVLNLVEILVQEPFDFLTEDASVNARVGGALATWVYILGDFFVPHGLSQQAWISAREIMLNEYGWLQDMSLNGPPSGFGAVVFQGGWLSLCFVLWTWGRLTTSIKLKPFQQILVGTIPWIFMAQYYISSTALWLVVALAIYKSKSDNQLQLMSSEHS